MDNPIETQPQPEDFDTIDEYEQAVDQHENQATTRQETADNSALQDDVTSDPYGYEKTQSQLRIAEHSQNAELNERLGNIKEAQLDKEREKIEREQFAKYPESPATTARMEAELQTWEKDLETAADNPEHFQKIRQANGDEKTLTDMTTRCRDINLFGDHDYFWLVPGDAYYRDPDKLKPAVKIQCEKSLAEDIRQAAKSQLGGKGGSSSDQQKFIYDRLEMRGLIPKEDPLPDDISDEDLDKADPGNMSQAQYERYRARQGAAPNYRSAMPGVTK